MQIIARRCFVRGRVQGVFYRASARERALELGCAGHARNLEDGRVEVLAIGSPQSVHELVEWLWQGPPTAQVEAVSIEELSLEALTALPETFTTG